MKSQLLDWPDVKHGGKFRSWCTCFWCL